jgi:hypothetical protein
MPRKLTPQEWDAAFRTLETQGFCIVESYFEGEQLAELVAAMKRSIPPYDELKAQGLPEGFDGTMTCDWPFKEHVLNVTGAQQTELIDFSKRWLGTDDIQIRVGIGLARYPGFEGKKQGVHVDNGNNSLLPMPAGDTRFSEQHRRFGQIQFWCHLEEVRPGQAPLQLIPLQHGTDVSKAVELVCPAGSMCIFTNYTYHSANDFVADFGQRYTWGVAFGRADSTFEGFKHYTALGANEKFQELISALTPRQRELFRFPKVGDPCYTEAMLEALEERYPGFDKTGEYVAAMASSVAVLRTARL